MSVGGSKSSGASSEWMQSPWAKYLLKQSARRYAATEPLLEKYTGQATEALQTGGINARIPIINRNVDAARRNLATSMEGTRQQLARSGLGKTSFGQRMLAELGRSGEGDIASIGPSIASQMISTGSPFAMDTAGLSGVGSAASLNRFGRTHSDQSSMQWGFDPGELISAFFLGGGGGRTAPTSTPTGTMGGKY